MIVCRSGWLLFGQFCEAIRGAMNGVGLGSRRRYRRVDDGSSTSIGRECMGRVSWDRGNRYCYPGRTDSVIVSSPTRSLSPYQLGRCLLTDSVIVSSPTRSLSLHRLGRGLLTDSVVVSLPTRSLSPHRLGRCLLTDSVAVSSPTRSLSPHRLGRCLLTDSVVVFSRQPSFPDRWSTLTDSVIVPSRTRDQACETVARVDTGVNRYGPGRNGFGRRD